MMFNTSMQILIFQMIRRSSIRGIGIKSSRGWWLFRFDGDRHDAYPEVIKAIEDDKDLTEAESLALLRELNADAGDYIRGLLGLE